MAPKEKTSTSLYYYVLLFHSKWKCWWKEVEFQTICTHCINGIPLYENTKYKVQLGFHIQLNPTSIVEILINNLQVLGILNTDLSLDKLWKTHFIHSYRYLDFGIIITKEFILISFFSYEYDYDMEYDEYMSGDSVWNLSTWRYII